MTSGAHHHLKRLNAPIQWGLDKFGGKYAVRPLPGPHNKSLSIPLKYIIARFLKVANTSKEIEYIISEKMISINGKDADSGKFPVGLFDVITIKKSNLHFRLYFGPNKKFKLRKISSDEAQFRITKVVSKYVYNRVPLTAAMDGFNFKFADPSINVADTVKVDIKTNQIVSAIGIEVGKIGYVFLGTNAGRMGVVKRIDIAVDGRKTIQLQDKNMKLFNVPEAGMMVVGNDEKSILVSFDQEDGVRLNNFERSNIKYATEDKVEVEDD